MKKPAKKDMKKPAKKFAGGGTDSPVYSGTIDRSEDDARRLRAASERFRASMSPTERIAAGSKGIDDSLRKLRASSTPTRTTTPAPAATSKDTKISSDAATRLARKSAAGTLTTEPKGVTEGKRALEDIAKKYSASRRRTALGGTAKAAPAPAKSSAPAKAAPAKAPNYPVYKKDSAEAKSFRAKFAEEVANEKKLGKKAGSTVFEWGGRKYTTKMK